MTSVLSIAIVVVYVLVMLAVGWIAMRRTVALLRTLCAVFVGLSLLIATRKPAVMRSSW